MINKHEMRKGYYKKMQEWKKKQALEKNAKRIDIQKEKALRDYQNIAKADQLQETQCNEER